MYSDEERAFWDISTNGMPVKIALFTRKNQIILDYRGPQKPTIPNIIDQLYKM
jgi:hypothetical protein